MKKLIGCTLLLFLLACGQTQNKGKSVSKLDYAPLSIEDAKKLITPTVYYIPEFDQAGPSCSEIVEMKNKLGKTIVRVCKNVYNSCVMQGTCKIKMAEKALLINVGSLVNNDRRFEEISKSECIYGRGASQDSVNNFTMMCLDPYHSVAADLSIYKLGDVIYVPAFVGTILPNGETHDGYFVVRDTGGAIEGYGRFDFFSGFDSYKDRSNPLAVQDFNDKATHLPYYVILGPKAAEILKLRHFPSLPVRK